MEQVIYGEVEGEGESAEVVIRGQSVRNALPIADCVSHAAFSSGFVAETCRKSLPLVVEDVALDPRFEAEVRARWLRLGIRSLIAVSLNKQGRKAVIFGLHHLLDAHGEVMEWFGMASDVTGCKQAEVALREAKEQLASDLITTRRLQEISTRLIQVGSEETLYRHILDAASAIMHSDFASMQKLYPLYFR